MPCSRPLRKSFGTARRGWSIAAWYGTPDYNFYTGMPVNELNKVLAEAVEAVSTQKPLSPDMAIIPPSLPNRFTEPDGVKNDYRDLVGVYKAVTDSGAIADVWTLNDLRSLNPDLTRYKAVYLPDCAYAQRKAVDCLRSYVKSGGMLINSGRLPVSDEIGDYLKSRLPGAKQPRYGRDYWGPVYRTAFAGKTPPLFIEKNNAPSREERWKKIRRRLFKDCR